MTHNMLNCASGGLMRICSAGTMPKAEKLPAGLPRVGRSAAYPVRQDLSA